MRSHYLLRYARRFFHHLLEFGRLEKAFLLAKDIQDRDLFVDIYFNAKKCGETTVAKAAKQKMIELYTSSEEGRCLHWCRNGFSFDTRVHSCTSTALGYAHLDSIYIHSIHFTLKRLLIVNATDTHSRVLE